MSSISGNSIEFDHLEISLRAYVPSGRKSTARRGSDLGPSEWSLIFDTETTTDARQRLKFGVYQVRKGQELWGAGFFIDPEILTNWEIQVIRSFSREIGYKCISLPEFIENVFFGIAYELRATIIGFNLPFDISRLAIGHGASRGRTMKGGFSFCLSPNPKWPRVQVKHLSSRISLIRFTTRPGQISGRGMRKRKMRTTPRPGYFVDVGTFATALTSRSFSLGSLADFLKTEHRKLGTEEHGQSVTDNYASYARTDVQVTWECYCKLLEKYAEHGLAETLPYKIFSEASVGKAYLQKMKIRPWRQLQPDFPNGLIGIIMSTYFGGRAEVHHRRIISEVAYCDFLSMYPTVCTLMKLWKFVIAEGVIWRDCTRSAVELLDRVSLAELQDPKFWTKVSVLVQIIPDGEIVPVRANYDGDQQSTIGLNHLYSDRPMWFTLADCIASKLLTGKAPRIIRAICFTPGEVQPGLRSIAINGNSDYRIEPYKDDFYCRLIDLRSEVKSQRGNASASDREKIESTQLTLKILANATSYGNFVELNVENLSTAEERECFGLTGQPFTLKTEKIEEPGRYFHPLIGTLITGAARLMLAITERLILDHGLDWAFCDTDSMAIARPADVNRADFTERVDTIRNWFVPLNPYSVKGPLLKLEDVNFAPYENGELTNVLCRLYCFAISAKRYGLFNRTKGAVVVRKASAHGLGHLMPPYVEEDAPASIPPPKTALPTIGVDRWQYDLWHQIVCAALAQHSDQVELAYHPDLDQPAASRYGASTPSLVSWFDTYNERRAYTDQVRPSNFLLAYQVDRPAIQYWAEFMARQAEAGARVKVIQLPKPVAPFDRNPGSGAMKCFDRDTGLPVPPTVLKTYRSALAQYHLRPESKFLNGGYTDVGITRRRHVRVAGIRHIGKESNRWEERFFLGTDGTDEIDYGSSPADSNSRLEMIRSAVAARGQREVSRRSGVSRRTIARFLSGKGVRLSVLNKIILTVEQLICTMR